MLVKDYIYQAYLRWHKINKFGVTTPKYGKQTFHTALWDHLTTNTVNRSFDPFLKTFQDEWVGIFKPKFIAFLKDYNCYRSYKRNLLKREQILWRMEQVPYLNGSIENLNVFLHQADPLKYVDWAFYWRKTRQGQNYWVSIDERWKEEVKATLFGYRIINPPKVNFFTTLWKNITKSFKRTSTT